jgi:lipid-binding SYLF domain-containing protein
MNHFKIFNLSLLAVSAIVFLNACAAPKGDTKAEKTASVQQMRTDTLAMVYEKMPEMKDILANCPGYGVFSGFSAQTVVMSSSNAYGIIHDKAAGKDTYMRAIKLGAGLGAGAQTVRVIVVFDDAKTMQDVLDHGWSLTGRAEAAAKAGDVGDSKAKVITLPGMSIYRFTQNGALVGGALEGAKVWKDKELN